MLSALALSIQFATGVILLIGVLAMPAESYAQEARLLVTVTGRDADGPDHAVSGAAVRVALEADETVVYTGKTDSLGIAEVIVPALRSYRVTATRDGYVLEIYSDVDDKAVHVYPAPGDVAVSLGLVVIRDPGPDIGEPSPPLPAEGSIFGRVVFADGTPLPLTAVHARGQRWNRSTTTAEDGSFRLRLLPDVYTIQATGKTYHGSPVGSQTGDYPSSVVVRSRTVAGPVDLVLEPFYLFTVTVIVTNDLGDRVAGADVELTGGSAEAHLPTDNDGVLTLGPFRPGRNTIVANARLGDSEYAGMTSVEIRDADQEVTVVLMPAATLSGRVEFAGRSTPVHDASGLHVSAIVPDGHSLGAPRRAVLVGPDGRFTLSGLVGKMCVAVVGMPYPWDVVDVTQEGLDVTNKVLTFKPGEEAADVLIRIAPRDGPRPVRPCKR